MATVTSSNPWVSSRRKRSQLSFTNLQSYLCLCRKAAFSWRLWTEVISDNLPALRKDEQLQSEEIIAPWGEKREKMRKSLISIISWISLWVTQHHREKKMASFHGGWGKREWDAFIAVNHSESTRGKAALAAFVVNALPRFICLSQILHLQLEPTWLCGKTFTFLD